MDNANLFTFKGLYIDFTTLRCEKGNHQIWKRQLKQKKDGYINL